MAKIVKISDFIGEFALQQSQFTNLQSFIDKYEKHYLNELLGLELSDLLYADIVSPSVVPITAMYLTIFNHLVYENSCEQNISFGIKEMLVGFIYWDFVRTNGIKLTVNGYVNQQSEVSTPVDWNNTNIYTIYNMTVKTYRAIQIYVINNFATYPEFKGVMKSYTHGLL